MYSLTYYIYRLVYESCFRDPHHYLRHSREEASSGDSQLHSRVVRPVRFSWGKPETSMSVTTCAVSATVSTPRAVGGSKKHHTMTAMLHADGGGFRHHRHHPATNTVTRRRGGAAVSIADRRRAGVPSTAAGAGATASPDTSSMSSSEDKSDRLSLDNVRASLIRQEDSIIFGLIERAQYLHNKPVYEPGGVEVPCFKPDGTRASMLEFMLRENEQVGGKIRRYTSPDEHAFYPDSLPLLVIGAMSYPNPLAPAADSININDRIMDMYVNNLVPALCQPGDDFNYGGAVEWRGGEWSGVGFVEGGVGVVGRALAEPGLTGRLSRWKGGVKSRSETRGLAGVPFTSTVKLR